LPAAPGTIGARLKELRGTVTPRMSQERLAEAAGLSVEIVKALEQGRRNSARLETLRRLADALGEPVAALATGPPRATTPALEEATASEDSLLVGPFPDQSVAPVSAEDVATIRTMVRSLTSADRQFGGRDAREAALSFLRSVVRPRLHAPATDAVREDLFAAATEFALRTASMHLDAGDPDTSRRLLSAAFGMARETGDPTLTGWVLSRMGEQAIFEQRIGEARGYTSAAVEFAGKAPPVAHAFLLVKQALSLSLIGDRSETRTVLGKVHDSLERGDGSGEPPWIGSYGWPNLRHDEGLCNYHLGLGIRAAEAAEESMRDEARRQYARPHAFSLGLQACGYAIAGEVEQACVIAGEFIDLAGGLSSVRVQARLREILTLLAEHRDADEVENLVEKARPMLTSS
jgi:transcriptional regulator with XRE-family HTH domain